jgi:hypothetical protein
MATLDAKSGQLIRGSDVVIVARICSAVPYSIALVRAPAHGAEVNCSGCMMRGCDAEQGEVFS